MSSAKQAEAAAGLSKAQARKVRTEVETQIPAAVTKLEAEGDLARANISKAEAEERLKSLTGDILRLDKEALEKMGLSMAQMQYKPTNQIGSMLINELVTKMGNNPRLWEMTNEEIIAFLVGAN
jgi:hypothetical protein